ncbi:MAG: hypothetical protein Q9202_005747 [Teloschistes flavicans]
MFRYFRLLVVYGLFNAINNSYNHALSRFPSPPTASFSNLSYSRKFLSGQQPYEMLNIHNKYGPIVRVAPNELSFSTFEAWRDIHGFRQGHQTFIKGEFYEGGSFAGQGIKSLVSERNPKEHAKMRKYLSHAFSDRSLKEQEFLISEVVDLFVEQIGKEGAATGQGIDLVTWFNLTTFDIITSLAFGDSFKGVETGKTHFWISIVISTLGQGALADVFTRFPIMRYFMKWLIPSEAYELTKKHEGYTIDLVTKRINRQTDRKDFMTRILENRDPKEISDLQLAAHSSDFVVAGSETTATTLSAINYYLIRTPHVRRLLQNEIRTSFKSYEEIDATSTAPLKYLDAVIWEGMRIYPPVPLALPRIVPEGGDTVAGEWLPGGTVVAVNPVAAALTKANFSDPFKFKPERWLGENARDHLDAVQPFSMGPRGCLGRSLAWMEIRTILAKMHFQYDFRLLNTDVDFHRDSEMHTLWNKPRLMVHVVPREEATTRKDAPEGEALRGETLDKEVAPAEASGHEAPEEETSKGETLDQETGGIEASKGDAAKEDAHKEEAEGNEAVPEPEPEQAASKEEMSKVEPSKEEAAALEDTPPAQDPPSTDAALPVIETAAA